jgi:hypothetical protein
VDCPHTVFAHACRLGAEGIVSKRIDGTSPSLAAPGSRSAMAPALPCSGSAARCGIGEPQAMRAAAKAKSRGRARRSEDQRPDWIERERNACAEPKGGGCAERVAGVCAEREGGGCGGRAAARARLFASYRPTTHPVAAPNIVGQRPAGRAVPASRPRPTK